MRTRRCHAPAPRRSRNENSTPCRRTVSQPPARHGGGPPEPARRAGVDTRGCAGLAGAAGGSLPAGVSRGCLWGEGLSRKWDCGSRDGVVLSPPESGRTFQRGRSASWRMDTGRRLGAPWVRASQVAPACSESAVGAAHGAKGASAFCEYLTQRCPPPQSPPVLVPLIGVTPARAAPLLPLPPCPRKVSAPRSNGTAPSRRLPQPAVPPSALRQVGHARSASSVTPFAETEDRRSRRTSGTARAPKCRRCPRKTRGGMASGARVGQGSEAAAGPGGVGGARWSGGVPWERGVPARCPRGSRPGPGGGAGPLPPPEPLLGYGRANQRSPAQPGPGTTALYGARRPRGAARITI